ncbi:thiolase family protein [uncultured Flavonifractor sp.]|uniref:thiolase family protein n=1 Tax=uncultured Flavonifractor sp. TaxID=1193534 RepID=UPI002626C439|nr:thiolase family protein [uncultured Flavonifractor sp.]
MMAAREVVFVDGARTGFGRMGGSLRDLCATDLSALAVRGLLEKTKILERGKVDSLFCGTAAGDSKTLGPARYTVLASGLPIETSASYVEMQCGSAIDSINHAAWKMLAGEADVMIAGGMESYSQMICKFPTSTAPYKNIAPAAIPQKLAPTLDQDITMLEVSDLMARRWGISREECDEFAFQSQQRAGAAIAKGYFKEEIVPITLKMGKKLPDKVFAEDEHVRPDTTLEGLGKLKAVLGADGVTTAGNASGRNDGAAFVLMMTAQKAEELGYEPYARWVCGADYGVEPRLMGIGPAYSNLMAIRRAGLSLKDIDVLECNEAFAAQNLSVIREMEAQSGIQINRANWNPNGGAIAFGHPNGASGARICMFAMKELARRGTRYGLFSSCCGGGHGVTTLIENLRR